MVDPPWVAMLEKGLWIFEDFLSISLVPRGMDPMTVWIMIGLLVASMAVLMSKRTKNDTHDTVSPQRAGALRVAFKSKRATYKHFYDNEESTKILSESNILHALSSDPDMSSVRVAYTS
jgi:hypothetical protein